MFALALAALVAAALALPSEPLVDGYPVYNPASGQSEWRVDDEEGNIAPPNPCCWLFHSSFRNDRCDREQRSPLQGEPLVIMGTLHPRLLALKPSHLRQRRSLPCSSALTHLLIRIGRCCRCWSRLRPSSEHRQSGGGLANGYFLFPTASLPNYLDVSAYQHPCFSSVTHLHHTTGPSRPAGWHCWRMRRLVLEPMEWMLCVVRSWCPARLPLSHDPRFHVPNPRPPTHMLAAPMHHPVSWHQG